MIWLVVIVSHIPLGALVVIIPINSAFIDNLYFRLVTCTAIGGKSSDTGDTRSGDIGPRVSCFASDRSTIGDEYGESKGSSEPSSGNGNHYLNGGNEGEDSINQNIL